MAPVELAADDRYLSAISRLRARVSLTELVGRERRQEVDAINWQLDPWWIGKASVALHQQVRTESTPQSNLDQETVRRGALVDACGWEALAGAEHEATGGMLGVLM